jgi:hypothetical protein
VEWYAKSELNCSLYEALAVEVGRGMRLIEYLGLADCKENYGHNNARDQLATKSVRDWS